MSEGRPRSPSITPKSAIILVQLFKIHNIRPSVLLPPHSRHLPRRRNPQGNPSSLSATVLYESLLLKLATVLEITRETSAEGGVNTNPQARQKLLQATNDFKNSLAKAKEIATNIPGGEFTAEEQDEIIEMLEALRDRKRAQLAQFASQTFTSAHGTADANIEVDSMASTPFGG